MLEDNGIATFLSGRHTNRLHGIFAGAFQVGLWVILDEQLDDALRLLEDPDHEVSRKLSRAEIISIREDVNSSDMTSVLRPLIQLLVVAAIVAAGVGYVVFR